MTHDKTYDWGFEDGFSGQISRESTLGLNSQEKFAYRKGYAAGMKAAEEMAAS